MESNEQRDLTYEKLKGCNPEDFNKACNDDEMIIEIGRYGLTYAVLRKYINMYRSAREREEDRAKEDKLMKESRGFNKSDLFKEAMKGIKDL